MPWTPSANAIAMLAVLKQEFTDAGYPALQAGAAPGNGIFHEALFDAFVPYFGGLVNGHTEGAGVAWAGGAGAGQIEIGTANTPAAPHGTFTSASGCDEGGILTFAAGANTSSGVAFIVHFAQAFSHAPAVVLFGGDANGAHVLFNTECRVSSTTTSFSFTLAGAGLANQSYTLHWNAKGAT